MICLQAVTCSYIFPSTCCKRLFCLVFFEPNHQKFRIPEAMTHIFMAKNKKINMLQCCFYQLFLHEADIKHGMTAQKAKS